MKGIKKCWNLLSGGMINTLGGSLSFSLRMWRNAMCPFEANVLENRSKCLDQGINGLESTIHWFSILVRVHVLGKETLVED